MDPDTARGLTLWRQSVTIIVYLSVFLFSYTWFDAQDPTAGAFAVVFGIALLRRKR
jgi:hypothetical protein